MILKKTIITLLASLLFSSLIFGQDRLSMYCPEPVNEEFMKLSSTQIDSIVKHYGPISKSGIIKVPIVFHVLTDDPTGVSNISDCIIKNQVEILNNCFRKKAGTQGFNSNSVGADTGIEFFLPCKDGNGNATTGIIRTNTTKCVYSTLNDVNQLSGIKSASSGANNFPNNKFLNVWVVKTMPNNNTVRAQAWWGNTSTGDKRTGVVIHYSYLGSKNSNCPNIGYLDITGYKAYDLGATLVHEIGHYFSLQHTYGQTCSYSDLCGDTPAVSGLPNPYCGTDNDTKGVCVSGQKRMWQNYLDYSDDACMNIFTNDQKTKMLTYISNTTNYKSLTSTANIDAVSCPVSPVNFIVNTSSNPTIGGTTIGGGTFASGTNVTVSATPNSGYTFSKWTENGNQVSTNASYTFTLSANRNLVATFSQNVPNFVVNTSSNPTIGGTTIGGGTFASGTNVTVSATPNSGYTFSKWTENGNQVSTNASYSFSVNQNRNLVANFNISTSSLEEKFDEKLVVFPNPVSSELTIRSMDEILNEIKIYNLFGEQLILFNDLNTSEFKLNSSTFENGIYIVEIKLSNGNRLIKKITKLR